MRAGRLDRYITIRRKTETLSETGAVSSTWADLGERRRAASVAAVRGDERFAHPQIIAHEQTEFRVRWSAEIADLSALDQVIYPALSGDSPDDEPSDRETYDILAVHELGRNEGLQIIARRRADTAA